MKVSLLWVAVLHGCALGVLRQATANDLVADHLVEVLPGAGQGALDRNREGVIELSEVNLGRFQICDFNLEGRVFLLPNTLDAALFSQRISLGAGAASSQDGAVVAAAGERLVIDGPAGTQVTFNDGDNTFDEIVVGLNNTGQLMVGLAARLRTTTLTVGLNAGSSGRVELVTLQFLPALIQADTTIIGRSGAGSFLHSRGTHEVREALILGQDTGSSGTYDLEAGSLSARQVQGGQGFSLFNFNGGTLDARVNDDPGAATPFTFFAGLSRVNVRGGGARIDTNEFNVTVVQPLLHSNIAMDAAIDGGLTKNGTGTLTLSGVNTYTGGTIVNAGTLTLAGSGNLGATSGSITVSGGTLDLAGRSLAAGTVTIAGGTIRTGGLTGTAYDGQSGTVNTALGGGGVSLAKTTSGLLALTAANSYSGGTEITEGTLLFGRPVSMPVSGLVTASSGAVLAVNVGAVGEFALNGTGAGSVNGLLAGTGGSGAPVFFEANSFLGLDTTNAAGGSATYATALTASGPGLVKLGANTLVLTANNTNSVGTQLRGGTLALSGSGATLGSPSMPLLFAGGDLDLGGTSQIVGAVTNNGGDLRNGTLTGSSYTFLANSTVSARLGGSASLTKLGDRSTTTLTGANTYSGGTIVSAGTLVLSGAGRLGSPGSALTVGGGYLDLGGTTQTIGVLTETGAKVGPPDSTGSVISNGTLIGSAFNFSFNNTTGATVSANLAGSGAVTVAGNSGTATLSGNNSYTGGTFLNAATLHAASAGALGSGPVTFGGGVLQLDENSGNVASRIRNSMRAIFLLAPFTGAGATLSSSIDSSNTSGFALLGGILALAAPNAFTGSVNLLASQPSTLQLSGAGTLGNSANALNVYNERNTLDLGGTTQTVGAIGLGGILNNAGQAISDPGGTIRNGTLQGTSLTSAGGMVTANLWVSGGITKFVSNGIDPGILAFTGNQVTTGAVGAKSGFDVTGGTFLFGDGATLDLDSLANGGSNLGTYRVDGFRAFSRPENREVLPTLRVTGASTALSVGELSVGVDQRGVVEQIGGSVTATEILLGAGGSYQLEGGLLRPAALGGAGVLQWNGGTLQTASNLTSEVATNLVRNGGARIDTNGFTLTLAQPLLHSTIAGDSATDGGLLKSGTGTLILSGANTYTGGTTVSGGTLQLGNGTSILGNIVNNATVVFANPGTQTFDGAISGSGGLTKQGAGTLTFSGAAPNTYGGETFVNEGTLVLAKASVGQLANFGSALGGNLLIASGATARYAADSQVRDDRSIVNSGLLDLDGFVDTINNLTLLGGSVTTGSGYVNVRGSIAANDSPNSSFAGNLHLEAATPNAARIVSVLPVGTFTISGVIANGDNGLPAQLNKTGGGTLIYSGSSPNTYTGDTVVNGGTLVLSKGGQGPANDFGSALGGNLMINNGATVRYGADSQVRDARSITVNAGGLLDVSVYAESLTNLALNGGAVTASIGYLNVRGTVSADSSPSSNYSGILKLEVPTANAARTISVANGGTLSIPGRVFDGDNGLAAQLNKTGDGTLDLRGVNLYSGGTTVSGGTLLVNNSALSGTGAGPVTVQDNATLGGGGRIAGAVTVQSSGTLAPGNSAGQLTISNNVSLLDGSHFALEIGGNTAGSDYDQLSLAGQLTLGGDLRVSLVDGFTPTPNSVFGVVVNLSNLSTQGTFKNAPNGIYVSPAGRFAVNYTANLDGGSIANDLTLTYLDSIPEPGTAALWLFAAAHLVSRRRWHARPGISAGA